MSPVEQFKAFDAAAFVGDLDVAGCWVVVDTPIRPDELSVGYFIAPSRRYTSVMGRWADAMEACPDHVDRVVAHLVERNGTSA